MRTPDQALAWSWIVSVIAETINTIEDEDTSHSTKFGILGFTARMILLTLHQSGVPLG